MAVQPLRASRAARVERELQELRSWLFPTLLTLPVFLVAYRHTYRKRWQLSLLDLLPFALLAYLLTPFNPAAFAYLAYPAIFAPYVLRGWVQPLLVSLALVALHAIEIVLIRQPEIPITIASATLYITLSCLNGHFRVESQRKAAALLLSHAEIRRLATLAERERIGRDLHDLLGHTLSLIAIKSELAGRLMDRDRAAAGREIEGVTGVAREALKEVRAAVTGIRSATLACELVSAQALLESSGVELTFCRDETVLAAETETALAMIVREAATNIQRHAHASRARIEIVASRTAGAGTVTLLVEDDGRGGAGTPGNGLNGIAERVNSLGGSFDLASERGHGTRLRACLPLGDSDYRAVPVPALSDAQ